MLALIVNQVTILSSVLTCSDTQTIYQEANCCDNPSGSTDFHVQEDCVNFQEEYDYVIVGAGTAGSLIASRILERPENFTVLLLEAGPWDRDIFYTADLKSYGGSDPSWSTPGTHSQWVYNLGSMPRFDDSDWEKSAYAFGKIVGGTQFRNGGHCTRGSLSDYLNFGIDEWTPTRLRHALKGWENVPKTATDAMAADANLQNPDDYHMEQPFGISMSPRGTVNDAQWAPPIAKAVYDGLEQLGIPYKDDLHNGDTSFGSGRVWKNLACNPTNTYDEFGTCLLDDGTFHKAYAGIDGAKITSYGNMLKPRMQTMFKNRVTVKPLNYVERVLFDADNKAIGVKSLELTADNTVGDKAFDLNEEIQYTEAVNYKAKREVLIGGGIVESPKLLMRSGIGSHAQVLNATSVDTPVFQNKWVGRGIKYHAYAWAKIVKRPEDTAKWKAGDNSVCDFGSVPEANRMYPDYMNTTVRSYLLDNNMPIPDTLAEIDRIYQYKIYTNVNTTKNGVAAAVMTANDPSSTFGALDAQIDYRINPCDGSMTIGIYPGTMYHEENMVHITPDPIQTNDAANPLYTRAFSHPRDRETFRGFYRAVYDLMHTQPMIDQFGPANETTEIMGIPTNVITDTASLDSLISGRLNLHRHNAASARAANAPENGVVDGRLRVFGTKNLRVVDVSVLPSTIPGHSACWAYTIGQLLSDMIGEELDAPLGSFPIYDVTQSSNMGANDFGYPIDRDGDGFITNEDKYSVSNVYGVTIHLIDWYVGNAQVNIPSMECTFIQFSASIGDVVKFQGKGTNTVELHRDSDWTFQSARTLCREQGLLYQAGSGSTNLADVNTGQTFEYTLSSTGTFLFTSSPDNKNHAGVSGQAVLVTVAHAETE